MPPIGSTFRTGEPLLHELLEQVDKGTIQLPDFQRGWVWNDERIRALIASVSLSYPIGAVMLMEIGDGGIKFAPRPVEGTSPQLKNMKPERLILDGQQRLTSLYLALRSGKPVRTHNEKKQEFLRFYYLDISKCLDPNVDRYEAVVPVPEDKVIRSDFNRQIDLDVSTAANEYQHNFFPLSLVFDPVHFSEWKMGYQEHHGYVPDKMRLLNRFEQEIWLRFQQYKVPIIELLKGTAKEAVCEVFENVNKGGMPLTVFELMTATYAADDFRLRDEWAKIQKRLSQHAVLGHLGETEFLQAVTLLATYRRHLKGKGAVGSKRKDILKLELDEYKTCAPLIEDGMVKAARLLKREKVFDSKNLPYQSQLVPLSAICAVLGPKFDSDPVKQMLARWYWCGVFGELYGGASEARFALDIHQVPAWIQGEADPRTLSDVNFAPTRLLTMQSRLSAAYKGIIGQLVQSGSLDFLTGDSIELVTQLADSVDIHHVFPSSYCEKKGYAKTLWNSVVNKAPLTAKTNRSIGGSAPSGYLKAIEKNHKLTPKRIDEILATHLIEPSFMRADDFAGFIRDRATRMLDIIEATTGRTVSGRDSDEVVQAFGGPLIAPSKGTSASP